MIALYVVAGAIAAAAYLLAKRAQEAGGAPPDAPHGGPLQEVVITAKRIPWALPKAGEPWRADFERAESRYNLPPMLVARVAYQESKFRPDIIDGRVRSAAGAVGIMQLIPRFHPGVDPLNPAEAIPYAAGFLRQLYTQLGSWPLAVAGYNAGAANVQRYKGVPPFPETLAYVRDVSRDVGLA